MATDWTAIRTEFVNGTMSARDLSQTHGIGYAGVAKRIEREGWVAERRVLSETVVRKANEALVDTRADMLAKFNAGDLSLASGFRQQVAATLQSHDKAMRAWQLANGHLPLKDQMPMPEPLSPNELRQLAGTAEVAQKMGRLALGATTESVAVTPAPNAPSGNPHDVSHIPDDRLERLVKQALDEC